MSLRPCPACRRHVVASATSCVFCAAALPAAPADTADRPGRFARAAVFAGATVLAGGTLASACGAPQPPPPPMTELTAPGPVAPLDAPAVATAPIDASLPVDAPPVDAAPPVAVAAPIDAGAPPAPVVMGAVTGVLLETPGKRPREGWEIGLVSPKGERVASAYTDERGRFSFAAVAPGPYTLEYLEFRQLRPHSNRPQTVAIPVTVPATGKPVKVKLTIDPQPVMPRSAQPMPYGAPPARRRVV